MRKIITLLHPFILIFTLINSIQALAQPQIVRQKCIGTAGTERGFAHCKDLEGNFLLAGNTSISSSSNIIIYKTDSLGNTIWNKTYGGTGNDVIYTIIPTSDGGFAFTALTSSTDGDVVGNHGGASDGWFVKCDNLGNIQSSRCFGGSGDDAMHSVEILENGNYLLIGYTSSTDGDLVGLTVQSWDTWLIEYNASGVIMNQKEYGGTSVERGIRAIEVNQNQFAVMSISMSNNGDVANCGAHGGEEYWLILVDRSTFQITSKKCYGGSSYDDAIDIVKATDGGFLMVGSSGSSNGNIIGSHGSGEAWVVKTDALLNLQWQRSCGGSISDKAYSVKLAPNGGYIISGMTNSSNGDVSPTQYPYSTDTDVWVFHLDENGNMTWQNRFGSAGSESTNTAFNPMSMLTINNDGSIVVFSTAQVPGIGFEGDVVGHIGGADFWLFKLANPQNTINGKLFYDINQNNIFDNGDVPAINIPVTTDLGPIGFSNANGDYSIEVFEFDTFSVSPQIINYHSLSPQNVSVNVNNANPGAFSNYNFAFVPLGNVIDAKVIHNPVSGIVKGFPAHFVIEYSNLGTQTIPSGTVSFAIPNQLASFLSASTTPVVNGNVLTWNFTNLAPYQSIQINFTLLISTLTNSGTPFLSASEIIPQGTDVELTNNINYDQDVIVAACDPNDIKVNKTEVSIEELQNSNKLRYTIRFQNTGTASAVNIIIKDSLSSFYKINTVALQSSSHPVELDYNEENKTLSFKFNGINLPDSTTNEPESHGAVVFDIKIADTLQLGTIVENMVNIFFDFEAPVPTNTETAEVFDPCVAEFSVFSLPTMLFADSAGFNTFQWIDCSTNEEIIGANSAQFYPTSEGIYKIIASNSNCSKESVCNEVITKTNDFTKSNLSIFPNPANDHIFISSNKDIENIFIYDMSGKLIMKENCSKKNLLLNTERLNSGIYFLWMYIGNETKSSKFMIQH